MDSGATSEKNVLFRGLNGTLGYIEFHFLELSWKSFDEKQRNQEESLIGFSLQLEGFSNYNHSFENDYCVGDTLDEIVEIKGWLGSKARLKFAISSTKKSMKPLFLSSDPFVILEKSSSIFELPLYSDSFLIGDAVLVMGYKFFPNQMSFPYLIIRCFHEYVYTDGSNHAAVKSSRFSSKFLVEMQSLLRGQLEHCKEESEETEQEPAHTNNKHSPNRSSRSIISANDSRKLLAGVDYLFRLVGEEKGLIIELLEGKSPHRMTSKPAEEKGNTSPLPITNKEYNVYYVAHVTKGLLSYLHDEYCDKAPAVDMILIDKLQSIFLQSLHTNASYIALLNPSQEKKTKRSPGNVNTDFDITDSSVWNTKTTIAFLVASAFWYIEQQLCNQNIFHQFFHSSSTTSNSFTTTHNTIVRPASSPSQNSPKHATEDAATRMAAVIKAKEIEELLYSLQEFASLVKRFQFYDTFATQMITWSDLPLLLQDLGGAEYSREEILFIIKQLDKERCGLIEFGDFIQWWCAEEDASEVDSLDLSASKHIEEESDEEELEDDVDIEEEEEEEGEEADGVGGVVIEKGIAGMVKGVGENGELYCMSIGEGKSLEDIVMESALFSSASADELNHQSHIDYLLNENDLDDEFDGYGDEDDYRG